MSNKDELTSERRSQILQAAAVVFSRNGVDGARMDDIVTESGLSKGTLYWYFDSKQDLAIALVDEVVGGQLQHLQTLLESPGSVVERLDIFLQGHAELMASQATLGRLGVEFYAMSGHVPRIREYITRYYDEYITVFTRLVEQGRDGGEFDFADTRSLALTLTSLIEGITLLWAIDPERIDLAAQLRDALWVLTHGLLRRDQPPQTSTL